MKIVVLDGATLGEDLSLSPLSSVGEVTVYKTSTAEEVIERIGDADVVVINKIKMNDTNLDYAKSLKLICLAATGYDNVDLDACRRRGIGVANVVGYSTHSVSQVALSLALSLYTHIPEYSTYVKDGSYTKSGVANRLTPVYHELCGKTWGVVGLGNIGRQVARCARIMGCRVLAYKRTPDEEFECVSLERLCRESDIISLHLPLSDSTRGIIDEEHIALMKRDAVLINVARGAVTDEEAVTKAIEENRIGAFGTDVYSTEPFSENHPFCRILDKENVLFTPHMAWGAYEARERCLSEIVKNIEAFKEGKERNRVDK
jgi:glycerate dehydrogenase